MSNVRNELTVGGEYNNTHFTDYGRMRLNGSGATQWNDVIGPLVGRQLNSTAGTVDYNWSNASITMSPNGSIANDNDCIIFMMQYPHAGVLPGTLNLHIHWEQPDATERIFTVQYAVEHNGLATDASWTTVASSSNDNSLFTYSSGTLNQITTLVDIPVTQISDLVKVRITRSDGNTGDIEATFLDGHFEMDTLGSTREYYKD
jgi:hypothetical protein